MTNPSNYVPPVIALTPELQQKCKNNLRFLNDLSQMVKDVSTCGVNCDHWEALRQRLLEINTNSYNLYCEPHRLPV